MQTFEFNSIRSPEFVFERTMETLQALRVRKDIAQRLAAYAAFQNQEFDPNKKVYVGLREDAGLEPEVNGQLAA